MITDDGENQEPYPKDEGDWFCQYSMRIEELEYLKYLRNRLFAMMSDYNYTEMQSFEVDEP